jgi:hypothetical protein
MLDRRECASKDGRHETFLPSITILFAALIATTSFAQSPRRIAHGCIESEFGPNGNCNRQPNPQELMKQMIEMSKLNNHMTLEWYENQRGAEKNTMELAYTGAGKK